MRAAGAFSSLDVTENSLISLGGDRLQKKHTADAVALQAFVTTLFPQSYRAFEQLGDAQQASGDRTAAQASYRKALEVNPRSTDGQRAAAASVERKIAGQS
jgi:Tfp pilus assembly protein PilF